MNKLRAAELAVTILPILLSITAARADDGGISFGGNPHLMKGHASVAMKNEVVKMDISDKKIKVDCNFVFHNSGPACTVRVGFPDEGQGSMIPYEGEPVPKNPSGTFTSYDSWVDGVKVKTTIVPTSDRSLYWHAKMVTFKANSDCVIRDVYTLPHGGQVTNENGVYQQTYYVLHTGSSWNGPIGKAEIIVNFAPDLVSSPPILKELKSISKTDISEVKWSALKPHTIVYQAPVQPKVIGNSLHFACTNLKPTIKDDIHLYYDYKNISAQK